MRVHVLAAAAALAACAPAVTAAQPEAPGRAGPWAVELVDGGGAQLPTFDHRGRRYVLGARGQRYAVRFRNGAARRLEVVVSVDGRDVVDGRPAGWDRRGYLVEPYGEVVLEGFRLNDAAVAAFRFGSVARSYAALTGDARDVGVIGVAVFPERPSRPLAPPQALRAPEGAPRASGTAPGASAPAPVPGNAPEGALADAAPSRRESVDAGAARRPGLGTEFGEERGSAVREVSFERASSRPAAVLALRYDDRAGLLALGIDVDRCGGPCDDAWLRATARPFRSARYAEPPPGWRSR